MPAAILPTGLPVLAAAPSAGQPVPESEMPPLAEWSTGPEAKTKPDYLYARCAALSLAIIKYDGISYTRPDLEHMKKTAVAFASTAAKERSAREGGKPEDYVGPISDQVEVLAEQYSGRIIAARQKAGRALDTDPTLAQDDETCRKAAGTPLKK